eukprot:9428780-Pyramimonas_sp.AAC.1
MRNRHDEQENDFANEPHASGRGPKRSSQGWWRRQWSPDDPRDCAQRNEGGRWFPQAAPRDPNSARQPPGTRTFHTQRGARGAS